MMKREVQMVSARGQPATPGPAGIIIWESQTPARRRKLAEWRSRRPCYLESVGLEESPPGYALAAAP